MALSFERATQQIGGVRTVFGNQDMNVLFWTGHVNF